ncbi:hypothetical protein FPV67DRAFT_1447945 [Lyophyllum atratum]|nr:hypothetical protein FPV67DRAFT_1447945 [Lyophyllum atratum]
MLSMKTYLASAILLVFTAQGAFAAPNPQETGTDLIYHCGFEGLQCPGPNWTCCGPMIVGVGGTISLIFGQQLPEIEANRNVYLLIECAAIDSLLLSATPQTEPREAVHEPTWRLTFSHLFYGPGYRNNYNWTTLALHSDTIWLPQSSLVSGMVALEQEELRNAADD